MPENALDNNKGIFIDIEQWEPWQKKGDVVGLLGFTPAGWVAAFTGYYPGPDKAFPVTIGWDAFTLQPNEWYTVRLEVDFVRKKFTFFSIRGPGVDKSWHFYIPIPLGYHDNPLPDEWVAVAIYIGVRELTEQEGMYALFDNVEFGVMKQGD
ncbi:MAG: hypothetical protein J7L53_12405 [Deltaproteobacteria bacterium]|nr:hypothetical protein [Deltaproteobacteria bacterium]